MFGNDDSMNGGPVPNDNGMDQSSSAVAAPSPADTSSPSTAGAPQATADAGAPTPKGAAASDPTSPHENPGMKILHGILGALGGTEETQVSRDPQTGKMIVTAVKKGPGQQWKQIIAGALTGAAAGASVKPGPGNKGRAAAAGFGAGQDFVEKQDQNKLDTADKDFDAQQKATVQNAQVAHMNQQIAESAWRQTREKADFVRTNTEASVAMNNLVTSNPANQDFGTYKSFADFLEKHGENGDQIGKMNANKELRAMPEFDSDGKPVGVRVYKVSPGWNDQKNLEPVKVDFGPKINPDGSATSDIQTIPAGGMSNSDIMNAQQAGAKRWLDYHDKTQPTPKDKFKEGEADKRNAATNSTHLAAANIAATAKDSVRSDKAVNDSYKYHNNELGKLQTPVDTLVGRMGRLVDTLNQKSPQADALVAPELLTVMAGGQGSGLRMNEAEISRIVGGRSKWQDLKAAVQKWDTDPKAARSITPEQDQQIRSLINEVHGKLLAKQKVLQNARSVVVNSDDPQEHKKAYANARNRLNIIDAGGATEEGFTRIQASDGSMHDIPDANLAEAKKRDPKLQVIGQ